MASPDNPGYRHYKMAGQLADRLHLYQGDALAVLVDLPTASVDALITDPPYSSGGMTRGDRVGFDPTTKYLNTGSNNQNLHRFAGDNRDQRGYAFWCALWLSEALRVLRPGGVAVIFTDWRQLPTTTDILQAGGFVWRGIVPWSKPNSRPQAGRFSAQCEYVVWGSAGPMPVDYTDDCLPGFLHAMPPRDREHMTEKPVSVLRELVRICPLDGVVLDPFMGTGTTGVAAMTENRRFIGVEITEHFAELARQRCLTAAGCAVPRNHQQVLGLAGAVPPYSPDPDLIGWVEKRER